jgi:hypothetical protein
MPKANSKRDTHFTRRIYRSLTKKIEPFKVEEVDFRNWLAVLLESERAADTLISEYGNDMEAMCATPVPLLTSLPNVGEAVALKIMAASKLFSPKVLPSCLSESIPLPLEV